MGQFVRDQTLGTFTRRRKRNIDWEVPHTRDSEFAFHDVGLVYLTDEIVLNHKQPIKLVPAMILALTQETEQARDRSTSTFKSRDPLTRSTTTDHCRQRPGTVWSIPILRNRNH